MAYLYGEPVQKKRKTCTSQQFKARLQDFEDLKIGISELYESRAYPLYLLQISGCNGVLGKGIPFTNSCCETIKDEEKIFAFGTIFSRGFEMLATYFETGDLPEQVYEKAALEKLFKFLNNDESLEFLINDGKQHALMTTPNLALALAEHVFSKLAFNGDYRLDWQTSNKATKCHCGCETEVDRVRHYGYNVIGHSRTWHGNLDIVLEKAGICVAVNKQKTDSPGFEEKLTKDFDDYGFKNQIVAQTIVFSFYKGKLHTGDCNNTLVPCIGISKEKIIFYFYDSVEDVLVQSKPASLVVNNKIQYPILVALWLVLNYQILGGGLLEQMKNGPKSNFHQLANDSLKIYQKEIEFGHDYQSDVEAKSSNHEEEPFYSEFVKIPEEDRINWSKIFKI